MGIYGYIYISHLFMMQKFRRSTDPRGEELWVHLTCDPVGLQSWTWRREPSLAMACHGPVSIEDPKSWWDVLDWLVVSNIFIFTYPLVNVYITMENHHFLWVNPLLMAIFNSYVKLPDGIYIYISIGNNNPNWRTPWFFRGVGISPSSYS